VLGDGRVIEADGFSKARIDPVESHEHHGMVSAPVLPVDVPPAISTLRRFSTARRKATLDQVASDQAEFAQTGARDQNTNNVVTLFPQNLFEPQNCCFPFF